MYNIIKKISGYTTKDTIIISIYITLLIGLLIDPLSKANMLVKSFKGNIGQALINNIDVTSRVNNMYFYLFVLLPIVFIITVVLISKLYQKNKYCEKIDTIKYAKNIALVGLVPVVTKYITRFQAPEATCLNYACVIPVLMITFLLINMVFLKISFKNATWAILISIPAFFVVATLLASQTFTVGIYKTVVLLFFIISLLMLLMYFIEKINFKKIKIEIERFKIASIAMAVLPILFCIFYEITNILNQYSIFINRKKLGCIGIILAMFLISIVIYVVSKKVKEINIKNYLYPIILAMFAMFMAQVPLTQTVSTDLFEQSNHGYSIYAFSKYGEIPVVENFDAHMLSNQISGYIYNFFNNDILGGVFIPYDAYKTVIYILALYFLFKKIVGKDIAFLTCLLFPITYITMLPLTFMGLLLILAQIRAIHKRTLPSYFLYWMMVVLTGMYALDIGIMFIIPSLIIWVVLSICRSIKVNIKKLMISFCITIFTCLLAWCCVCYIKEINPITRLQEFIYVAMSNDMWAYSTLGDMTKTNFSIVYFVIPIISIIMAGSALVYYFKNKLEFQTNNIDKDIKLKKNRELLNGIVILISLFLAFVFNFSRGLVRHSLVELNYAEKFFIVSLILNTLVFFIPLVSYYISKKNKNEIFIGTFFLFVVMIYMMHNSNNIIANGILEDGTNKYFKFDSLKTVSNQKENRIVLKNSMSSSAEKLKYALNSFLLPDETYIDNTNDTLNYVLTGRKKTVYINQSMGLLNNDFTQTEFIKQIKGIPLLLMPGDKGFDSMDGISYNIKFPKVMQYLYQYYRPLMMEGDYEFWCLNEKYDEYVKIYNEKGIDDYGFELFSETDKKIGGLTYSLLDLPYIMANCYNNKEELFVEKQELKNFGNNIFKILPSIINKTEKYALLEIDSPIEFNEGCLELLSSQNENSSVKYKFNIKKGVNSYIINISSDPLWYFSKLDTISLDVNIKINKLQVYTLNSN